MWDKGKRRPSHKMVRGTFSTKGNNNVGKGNKKRPIANSDALWEGM